MDDKMTPRDALDAFDLCVNEAYPPYTEEGRAVMSAHIATLRALVEERERAEHVWIACNGEWHRSPGGRTPRKPYLLIPLESSP